VRERLQQAVNGKQLPFVGKKIKKEIKDLLESNKDAFLSSLPKSEFTVTNIDPV
jgi:hypothetical protein